MSDTQQEPDWWLASDGKWYPPSSPPEITPSSGERSADIALFVAVATLIFPIIGGIAAIIVAQRLRKPDTELSGSDARKVSAARWIGIANICVWLLIGAVGAVVDPQPANQKSAAKSHATTQQPRATTTTLNVATTTSLATPSPTTAPTTTAAPSAPTTSPLPAFGVITRDDVSAGSGAKRLSLVVAIKQWPIAEDQVRAVAEKIKQDEKPNNWQAIAINFQYDKGEAMPSFGILTWAPGGKWENASKGNGSTWSGYQMNESWKPKMTNPASCSLPSTDAFTYSGEFNQAIESDPNADEDSIEATIASRHHTTASHVADLVSSVDTWDLC